jgi:hypothetical protein
MLIHITDLRFLYRREADGIEFIFAGEINTPQRDDIAEFVRNIRWPRANTPCARPKRCHADVPVGPVKELAPVNAAAPVSRPPGPVGSRVGCSSIADFVG